jgi:predicted GIY-YIG superfamily endonuclease
MELQYPWENIENIFYNLTLSKQAEMPKVSCVYVIINMINNKFYIGSAKRFNKRIVKHKTELRNNKHHNNYLQNAVNKYGVENFKVFILEVTNDYLSQEDYYIKKYKARELGYNLGLVETSIEINSKPVIQLDLNGNFINEFSSVSKACEFLGTDNTTNISSVCVGKALSYKNYIWVHKSDYLINKNYQYKHSTNKFIIKYDLNNIVIKFYKSLREMSKEEKISRVFITKLFKKQNKITLNNYVYELQ